MHVFSKYNQVKTFKEGAFDLKPKGPEHVYFYENSIEVLSRDWTTKVLLSPSFLCDHEFAAVSLLGWLSNEGDFGEVVFLALRDKIGELKPSVFVPSKPCSHYAASEVSVGTKKIGELKPSVFVPSKPSSHCAAGEVSVGTFGEFTSIEFAAVIETLPLDEKPHTGEAGLEFSLYWCFPRTRIGVTHRCSQLP